MGWTTMAMPREGARAYLDALYTCSDDHRRQKVIDSSLVGGREYYAAVETTTIATGDRTVFAGVALVSVSRQRGEEFGYKAMSEEMGPYYFNAPARILDRLTPTENPSALEWRAACRVAAEQRRELARRPKMMPGQRVRFEEPLKFSDGAVLREFDIRQNHRSGRGLVFVDPLTGRRYGIPKANARAFTIVAPGG